MTKIEAYKKLKAIAALNKVNETNLAANLERDVMLQFLRDAKFRDEEDEIIAQMILQAAREAGDRYHIGPATA